VLAALLRVAIGLDRTQEGRVGAVTVSRRGPRVTIHAAATGGADIELELYAANERVPLLRDVFGREVRVVAA
jgi:hypothetical protein